VDPRGDGLRLTANRGSPSGTPLWESTFWTSFEEARLVAPNGGLHLVGYTCGTPFGGHYVGTPCDPSWLTPFGVPHLGGPLGDPPWVTPLGDPPCGTPLGDHLRELVLGSLLGGN
jgi:hypothetical protein